MKEIIKTICERLTPTKDSQKRMLNNILKNMSAENILLKKKSFIKQPEFVLVCIGVCAFCILSTGYMIKTAKKTMNTPVYAVTISNNIVSLKKAPNIIENSNWVEFKDSEHSKFLSSDSGYTIVLDGGTVNGQVINLFFDITRDDNKKAVVDRQDAFSSLDMKINCKLLTNNHFEKEPIFEWFMLEDRNMDDNKIQFGISLWNDVGADRIDISISDLNLESSNHIFNPGQIIEGHWNLTVLLDSENKELQREKQVFILNQEIDYQGIEMILRSITYSSDTLSIELEDTQGRLNQKPFVDNIITIESNQKQIYPSYGTCTGEGTTLSLLYYLDENVLPESINALVIDDFKFPIALKTE